MGIVAISPSRIVRHARSIVTEQFSSGGRSKSRSRTCVRILLTYSGGSKPKWSSMCWVSSFIAPMRTALYSRSPSALRSFAYAIEATMESVSGLRCPETYISFICFYLPASCGYMM